MHDSAASVGAGPVAPTAYGTALWRVENVYRAAKVHICVCGVDVPQYYACKDTCVMGAREKASALVSTHRAPPCAAVLFSWHSAMCEHLQCCSAPNVLSSLLDGIASWVAHERMSSSACCSGGVSNAAHVLSM